MIHALDPEQTFAHPFSMTALLLALFLSPAHSAQRTDTLTIGDRKIFVDITENGPGPLYLNLHEDENTSVRAAQAVLKNGTLLTLRHGGGRKISFRIGQKTYKFDPNRIFSPAAVERSLPREGADQVKKFAGELLSRYIAGRSVIIALHNNTNGSLSAESYRRNSRDASLVALSGTDPDDFFLVLNDRFFRNLGKSFNVVLQNNQTVKDDGSLSVYFARRPETVYINVEAQHGHLDEQIRMLQALNRLGF